MSKPRKKFFGGPTPADYLKRPYQWVFIPEEEGGFCALIKEFPGCVTQGDTIQEAYDNLTEAATNWLEASLELGHVISEPETKY